MNEEWDDTSMKIGEKKKKKTYHSTKRKIKKFIPKEIDLAHITIVDNRGKQGKKIIDTDDIKIQASNLSGLQRLYSSLSTKLSRAKEELRLNKRVLPSHEENIENVPKIIEKLKKILNSKRDLLKKEEETPGYLKRKRTEFLEKARRKMEEDKVKEEERIKIEKKLFLDFDLESLKKHIDELEIEIVFQLESQDNSKDKKINYSHKIEELEVLIQDLEPNVKILREKLDEASKKFKAERNTNLMKLFDKKERENNNS